MGQSGGEFEACVGRQRHEDGDGEQRETVVSAGNDGGGDRYKHGGDEDDGGGTFEAAMAQHADLEGREQQAGEGAANRGLHAPHLE